MHLSRPSLRTRPDTRAWIVVAFLLISTPLTATSHGKARVTVDLHRHGFPAASTEISLRLKVGLFYLSADRVAIFFEQPTPDDPHNSAFQLLVFDANGALIAQDVLHGDAKAIDITPGPNGGILVGRAGRLDFYDSKLRLVRTTPLDAATTSIRFERRWNQIVVLTLESASMNSTAHFLDANTLQESSALTFPFKSIATFGKDELMYSVGGQCEGAAHIVTNGRRWQPFDKIPACFALAFLTEDRLAYALDRHVHVINSSGKEILRLRIPARESFQAPSLVSVSDDHIRLAIRALKKNPFAPVWAYYDEIVVYDLVSKRTLLKHSMPLAGGEEALSPNGHELATVERGMLRFFPLA